MDEFLEFLPKEGHKNFKNLIHWFYALVLILVEVKSTQFHFLPECQTATAQSTNAGLA